MGLLGLWAVTFDSASRTAEMIPLRGVQFTANVTQFMQPPFSNKNLMSVAIDSSSDWPNGLIICDVSFTHPFPGLDQFTGFDVRGVCIGDGTQQGVADANILYGGPDELRVLNADGYTRWFNPSEFTTYNSIFGFTPGKGGVPGTDFTATLNGYKYFCDDIGKETQVCDFFGGTSCSNPRGYYSAGNVVTRRYEIQFPMVGGEPHFYFQYAVVASWEPPTNIPPMNIPDDFPISANCHEVYVVSVVDNSDMYFDGSSGGGTLALAVRVFDHQGAVKPGGVHSEIGAIHLETQNGLIPGNLLTFAGASLDAALVWEDSISACYLLEDADVDPPDDGVLPLMIVIESVDPFSYDQGFSGFAFPDGVLSAYFQTTVTVGTNVPPTVVSIDPDNGHIDAVLTGVEVTGTNFQTGAEVTLIKNDNPGVVVEATNESVVGGTMVTCDLDLSSASGAEIGIYDVRVTNPVGPYGQLDDGFEIKEPLTDPYWWECIMYNSARTGRNPIATTPDPSSLTLAASQSAAGGYKFCTPVVAENKIFYASTLSGYYSDTSSRIYCHSLTTGAQLWNAQINPSNAYTRFMPGYAFYDAGDGTERLIVAGDQIYCFNANSSGTNPTPLWTYDDSDPAAQNWLGTQLTVYDGKVLAKGRFDTALYILNAQTGALIHEVDIQGGFESGVAGKDGKAYTLGFNFTTYLTYLECVDIDSGTIDWTGTTSYQADHWSGPCVDNGRVYFTTYPGRVFCFAAEDQGSYSAGDMIWYYQVPQGNPLNGGVAKLGDDLFCAAAFGGNPVYCITDTGDAPSVKWTSPVTGYWDGQTVVTTTSSYPNGVVIAAERDSGVMYFLNAMDGSIISSINTGESQRGGASLAGDYVVIVGQSNVRIYSD
jgi:hypothetical protein